MSKFKFWKPGDERPGSGLQEERNDKDSNNVVVFNSNAAYSVEQQRQRLPIFKHRNNILYLLETCQTVVIIGETGSGKSTQVPQYLVEAGWGTTNRTILITQPRRVAVVTLATRVADERGGILGDEVGYAIRFEDCSDQKTTKVKFVTDGLLVREMMTDPLLSKYSVVMLDEVHERTLYTDIVLGLLKKIMKKRRDLRIIVASATIDAEKFRTFFSDSTNKELKDCGVITVEGRMFPVDVLYSLHPLPDYIKGTVETVMKIHRNEAEGDVLCFLTGQDEVDRVVSLLIDESRKMKNEQTDKKMKILPMHGSLPASEQMRVFERTGRQTRKIVVATNIAEASITINGIVYVVDCGFVKLPAFNPSNGVESLVIIPVSKASAKQRAGRAGRVRSGKVFRLYTEEGYENLSETTVPEIERTNLAVVILQLKALGIANVARFNFLSPPPAENMVRGIELLYALGAVNDSNNLTVPLGVNMAEFPLHPMFSKMLLVSGEYGCVEEMTTIAAMVQIQNVFIRPSKEKIAAEKAKRRYAVEEGDHITMLNVFRAFQNHGKNAKWCHANYLNYKGLMRAVEIKAQLSRLLMKCKVKSSSCDDNVEVIQKCITAGLFANVAKYHYSGMYRTLRDDYPLLIHPTSVLYTEKPPTWVMFSEIVQTSKDFMRDITIVNPEWLCEMAPHFYHFGTQSEIAAKRARTVNQ